MAIEQFPTLHDLIANLTEYLNLTPEQQFRVTAKIKRHVHAEKASVFHRYFLYSQGHGIYEGEYPDSVLVGREPAKDEFLNKIMEGKYKQHTEMAAEFTDEELVTWDVGTHKFKQSLPNCSVCDGSIASPGIGYMGETRHNVTVITCKPCAEKAGTWDTFFYKSEEK